MRKIVTMLFCAVAFMFIAAPIYMKKEAQHQITINGKPFGFGILIGNKLAMPVDEFTKAVGGAANVRIQGNKVTIISPRLQPSSSADTFTLAQTGSSFTPAQTGSSFTPASQGSGGGAGKVKFNELHIKKTTDLASPMFLNGGRQFIWFDDVLKLFGQTTSFNGGTLAPGAPVNIHVAPNPGAAIAVGDVNG